MRKKQEYWSKYVEKCVNEKKHFALLNLLTRKNKIWVDQAPIGQCRDKRPTITDDVETTRFIWDAHYRLQYSLDNLPSIPHLNGLQTQSTIPKFYQVTKEQVYEVLKTKKGRSSPGPSGIRQEHLKLVNEIAPDFFCDFVNEELNNTESPSHWE